MSGTSSQPQGNPNLIEKRKRWDQIVLDLARNMTAMGFVAVPSLLLYPYLKEIEHPSWMTLITVGAVILFTWFLVIFCATVNQLLHDLAILTPAASANESRRRYGARLAGAFVLVLIICGAWASVVTFAVVTSSVFAGL